MQMDTLKDTRSLSFNAIVAVDEDWGIGKNGSLLTHIPADMAYFKQMTTGNIVIMGRKTFESLPGQKALPDRANIVITRDETFTAEDVTVAHSIKDALKICLNMCWGVVTKKANGVPGPIDVFVIGGGEIYKQLLDICETVYVTRIRKTYDADTFFPNLEKDTEHWRLVTEEPVQIYNGTEFSFCTFKRILTDLRKH